jgi:hypothetical protein
MMRSASALLQKFHNTGITIKIIYLLIPSLLILSTRVYGQSAGSLSPATEILFPRAFGIAVNQVGYMEGGSLGEVGGPWRAGIRRDMDVRDYRPIADVGKEVGIRFMSLFALAEMDRLNVVATLPNARPEGHRFDNSSRIKPEQIEIMKFVKDQAAYIELGVTGVGHEWWVDGERTRSEWYNLDDKEPRSEELMRRHMDVISNILGQYGMSELNGHSFPQSMSALGYFWNPDGPYSAGSIFSDFGVRYVNTKFSIIPELNPPPEHSGGFDQGVLVLDRSGYGNLWYTFDDQPHEPVENYETDLIESHWANWLAQDDFLQPDVNRRWVDYFSTIQAYPYRYLAKNSEQLYSQWLYKKYTSVTLIAPGKVRIDNSSMPEIPYMKGSLGNMVLSIPLEKDEHVHSVTINGKPVAAWFEEAGFGYIYLPPLQKETYNVEWKIGDKPVSGTINNTGTYNVYDVKTTAEGYRFTICMYGTQDVRFRVGDEYEAITTHEGFEIRSSTYNRNSNELIISLYGLDVQGETGVVNLRKVSR